MSSAGSMLAPRLRRDYHHDLLFGVLVPHRERCAPCHIGMLVDLVAGRAHLLDRLRRDDGVPCFAPTLRFRPVGVNGDDVAVGERPEGLDQIAAVVFETAAAELGEGCVHVAARSQDRLHRAVLLRRVNGNGGSVSLRSVDPAPLSAGFAFFRGRCIPLLRGIAGLPVDYKDARKRVTSQFGALGGLRFHSLVRLGSTRFGERCKLTGSLKNT